MLAKNRSNKYTSAFTIVELIIVIVIIAIVATVTIVAFTGIQKRAVASTLQDTLKKVATAMDTAAVDTSTYATLPANITLPDDVGIALMEPVAPATTSTTYCINATTQRYNNLVYHVEKGGNPQAGGCGDKPILAILGDYNENAEDAGQADPTTMDSRGIATSTSGPMNFRAETNADWSQLTLRWDPVEGADRYRVNHRSSSAGTWYTRGVNNSGGGQDAWDSTSTSATGALAPTTTTLTWTSSAVIPQNATQTHEYRIQYRMSTGTWSDWSTVSLNSFIGRAIPKIKNLTVAPNENFSSVTLSWDSVGTFANLPGTKIRVNHRDSPTGTWYIRGMSNSGAGKSSWDSTESSGSGALAPTTTSLTWTSSLVIPQNATQTHEYRIQVYSGDQAGEWTTVSLNQLSYSNLTMPEVRNLRATLSPDFSSVTLSWDGIGTFANLPGARIRVNHRDSPTGTWYIRGMSNSGAGRSSWDSTESSGSGALMPTATSLTWTSPLVIPQNDTQTHEYRIQVYSGDATGPWTTTSLARP